MRTTSTINMNGTSDGYRIPSLNQFGLKLLGGVLVLGAAFNFAVYQLLPSALDGAFFLSMFVGIVTVNITWFVKSRRHFRKHDYAWYRRTFPSVARADGRVVCCHCGGAHISARNLMNHTFHRAHVCNQCGETLYFSPEK